MSQSYIWLMLKNRVLIVSYIGILFFSGWVRILYEADRQPHFCDETTIFSAAAFNFFKHLNYNSPPHPKPFDSTANNGIAATWPSGLIWLFGSSLYIQWVIYSMIAFCNILLLGLIAGRRFFASQSTNDKILAVLFAVALWIWVLWLPYWHGFMLNLGESPAVVFILWALYLNSKGFTKFSSLLWGISVWHCKFIVLPFFFTFLGVTFFIKILNISSFQPKDYLPILYKLIKRVVFFPAAPAEKYILMV